jgi:hypothetical protein
MGYAVRKLRYSHAGGGTSTSQGPATQARRSYSDFCGSRDCRRRGTKRAGQRASVLSPQARTIAIALPRQTIALAARGAPIKLLYKQKIPSEPRTGAIPNHATPDRRSAKFMLSVIRKCCQSASEHAHATPNQITRNAGRRSPKEGPRVRRLTAGGRWIRTLGPPSAATPLSDRGVKPQAAASRLPLRRRDPPSGRP